MSRIVLALIKQLVANGQLDADDIMAMCDDLPERESAAVKAAWAYGLCPDGDKESAPSLRVIEGGAFVRRTIEIAPKND